MLLLFRGSQRPSLSPPSQPLPAPSLLPLIFLNCPNPFRAWLQLFQQWPPSLLPITFYTLLRVAPSDVDNTALALVRWKSSQFVSSRVSRRFLIHGNMQ
ncbi:hypothetical protein E2C01_091438 [Portunus trituberculatus]|uniref:Uncharacterized protein n=1 Tax=Portunus trituberculatus TaxID=210409 RepID=A0A5B7JPE0_PORTR|nr:hypothetical protein [Portunus trituberculatus]